ncbi:transcriptional regulator [Candidatus Woesearchaeota archaeon]|nr:MAG: transcriptional regulator [Candidatus Woesearchaeota archaeon]
MTRREEIIKLLSEQSFSLQQLANHFKTDVADLTEDIAHVKLSIHPLKLLSDPAFCKKCGYVFQERNKIKTPSKCPRCKSEWIEAQKFKIG